MPSRKRAGNRSLCLETGRWQEASGNAKKANGLFLLGNNSSIAPRPGSRQCGLRAPTAEHPHTARHLHHTAGTDPHWRGGPSLERGAARF